MGPRSSGRGMRRDSRTPLPDDGPMAATQEAREFCFTAHYPSRLRPNRVESIRVSLEPLQPVDELLDISRKKTDHAFPLRLLIPGALVTPAEHVVAPSPFGPVEVVFHVTALADGVLTGARLEVLRQGQLETIALPLRCESVGPVRWLLLFAVVVPLLLRLPASWPELATSGVIEREVRDWVPNVPALSGFVARTVQGLYNFLADTGKDVKISFFVFVGLAAAAATWAFVCRPQAVATSGETFRHVLPPKSGELPAFLSPASTADVGAIPAG